MRKGEPTSRENPQPLAKSPIILRDRPALWHGTPTWSWSATIPSTYFNFWVLMTGSVTLTLRGRTYTRTQPSYFLLPPGERVVASTAGQRPMANFALHVDRAGLDAGWTKRAVAATWGLPVRQFETFAETARACVESGNRASTSHQELAAALAHALLLRFWIDVTTPADSPTRERMFAMAGRIRQRPETAWRIDALAQESGYSRSRFTRLFTEATGVSPRAFITRCRLERARTLLKESSMSVSEIAYALGYSDVFFFSRHFKQGVGVSPLAWRRDGG